MEHPCIRKMIGLNSEGRYDEALKIGMASLCGPVDRIDKANICHLLGITLYNLHDWRGFIRWQKKCVEYAPDDLWPHKLRCLGNAIFTMHYLEDVTDKELAEAHFAVQKLVKNVPWIWHDEARKALVKREGNLPRRKLRIGYISGDFVTSVNMPFVIQLLAAYNHERFEVYVYHLSEKEDCATEFVQSIVENWRNLSGLGPEEAAKAIYSDKIDILFDISLHCGMSQTPSVVAYKPAPIIVGGIGYMSTSGMKAVDYFLTDVYCDPEGMGDEHFTERLLRLPHSHFCFTPREYSQKFSVNTKIHDNIVFGSLNDYRKLNDDVLTAWSHILQRVPNSSLLIQSMGSESDREWLREKITKNGIDLNRVEIRKPNNDYYATYNDMDIMLDSYPYVGGATTLDSLYMGVPPVVMYGTRHGTRFGYSIMQNLGLGELTVNNWEDYENLAVSLAGDRDLLEILHTNLRSMMAKSPLMDAKLYVRSIEEKYLEIWERFLQENT